MRTMWKFVLTIALACLTAAGSAAAADRGGQGNWAGGWQTADHRAWHRDDAEDVRRDRGRGRSRQRGESRQPRQGRDGDWRRNRNPQSVQDDYRSPYTRPPARDPRYDRDRRNDRDRRYDRDRRNDRDQRYNPDQRYDRNQRYNRDRQYNPDRGSRGRARDAYRRGKIVSLDRVMTVVQRRYGGRVLNVRLDDQRLVYHLRVLTRRGSVLRISVDARNARILSATGGRR